MSNGTWTAAANICSVSGTLGEAKDLIWISDCEAMKTSPSLAATDEGQDGCSPELGMRRLQSRDEQYCLDRMFQREAYPVVGVDSIVDKDVRGLIRALSDFFNSVQCPGSLMNPGRTNMRATRRPPKNLFSICSGSTTVLGSKHGIIWK